MRHPLNRTTLLAALALASVTAAPLAQRPAPAPVPASRTAATRLPEPKDVFGFAPGDDYNLASHEQILDYFAKLDAASEEFPRQNVLASGWELGASRFVAGRAAVRVPVGKGTAVVMGIRRTGAVSRTTPSSCSSTRCSSARRADRP